MEPFNRMPPELEQKLEAELEPDERVLWLQAPLPERWVRPKLPLRTRWLLLFPVIRAVLENVPDRILYVITSQRALILHKIKEGQIDVRVISPSEMTRTGGCDYIRHIWRSEVFKRAFYYHNGQSHHTQRRGSRQVQGRLLRHS